MDTGPAVASSDGLRRVVHHRAAPWVVLGVSLLTCVLGWYHGDRTIGRRAEERFLHQADWTGTRLQEALARMETVLRVSAAFAGTTSHLDRDVWNAYVTTLLQEPSRSVAGVAFTPLVRQGDLGDRYHVAYVAPDSERSRSLVGFDLAADPALCAAIARARDTGGVVLAVDSRPRARSHNPNTPALAMLMPVYAASQPLGSVQQRRAAHRGVVYAPFDLPELVAAALANPVAAPGFTLRDGGPDGPVLHRQAGPDSADRGVPFTTARAITIGDQRWTLAFESGSSGLSAQERLLAGLAALSALALNGALGALLFAQRRVRVRAEALAAQRARALQRSEGAFLAVAESARVAIVTTDALGCLTYANAAAEQMFGVSRDQMRGVSSMLYVADIDRDRFAEIFATFLAGEGRISAGAPTPITCCRHSGEAFPAELSLSWYDAPEGRYITGVLVDLTERLRAEAAAHDAEERWQVALESTDDGVWDWDVPAGMLYGSPRLFELVGHEAISGAIHVDGWTTYVHPDDLAVALRDLDAHLVGERDRYVSEYRVRTQAGDWRWVLARGRIVSRDAQGRPTRVVGTCADITDRRHTEETLRLAREQAEQATRSKSDFLAMMSHELRTPMNGVLGMTNLLASTPLTTEQREYLEMIGRSGHALLRLIDDILDFSKIEAGRVVLEQMACDMAALTQEVVTLLGVQAQSKGLQLDAHVVPGTPTIVTTDPGRVRQVLFNLVGNAIKFTEAGAVHVSVSADAVRQERVLLRLTVTDTGIGIAADTQHLLFDKFTQADASTTRRFGGTGLGLAISKGLVESLGGTIGVTSTVGVGSQFWFTFEAPIAPDAAPSLSPFTGDATHPLITPETTSGKRVLVAEDNPVNQRVAVRMLEKLGYVADVAVNGREAVRMAQETGYAVILMDCHMPEIDGYEATRQIASLVPADRRPPILAMTAAGTGGDRERCLAAGMSDYLAKPVQMPLLRAMLDRWALTAPD
jgi:PAS domain S-box-containing protein